MLAYKYEMQIIQKDMREIKRKYEDFMMKANRSDHVENLEKQLNFFRDEAQKLREMLEQRDKDVFH